MNPRAAKWLDIGVVFVVSCVIVVLAVRVWRFNHPTPENAATWLDDCHTRCDAVALPTQTVWREYGATGR